MALRGAIHFVALAVGLAAAAAAWGDAADDNVTTWLESPAPRHRTPWGLFELGRAQGSSRPGWRQAQSLTGNWGGVRDQLAQEYGVSLVGNYTSQCAGNPVGGRSQGITYTHNIGVSLLVNLDTLAGLDETYFVVSASDRVGNSLSAKHVGNVYAVQQIYGGETLRMVLLAVGRRFFDGTLDVVAGRINGLDDFIASPLYCDAQNLAFCGNPLSIPSDVNISSYPNTMWGARGRWEPVPLWYVMGGVYNAISGFRANKYHGVDFSIRGDSGVIGIVEAGIMTHRLPVYAPALDGHVKAAGYWDTEPLTQFRSGVKARGTWGTYVAIDQMVYGEGDPLGVQGLTLFAAYHHAPADVNSQVNFVDAGAVYQGLLPGRDTDVLGLYFARGWFSADLRASQIAAGMPGQDNETVLELNYRWNVLPWFYLQPDIQGILKPGAAGGIDDALVLALQFGFPF